METKEHSTKLTEAYFRGALRSFFARMGSSHKKEDYAGYIMLGKDGKEYYPCLNEADRQMGTEEYHKQDQENHK